MSRINLFVMCVSLCFLFSACSNPPDLSQPLLTAEQMAKALIDNDKDLLKEISMNKEDVEYLSTLSGRGLGQLAKRLQNLEEDFAEEREDLVKELADTKFELGKSKYIVSEGRKDDEGIFIEYRFGIVFGVGSLEEAKKANREDYESWNTELLLTKNSQGHWKVIGFR